MSGRHVAKRGGGMTGKQMEGDNQRRRALAREAREQGRSASEAGVTLGSSKQPKHIEHAHRAGPPAAGPHKRDAERVPPPAPPPGRAWPHFDPAAVGIDPPPVDLGLGVVRYRELVDEIARRGGLSFDQARVGAEATVVALARGLRLPERTAFLEPLPHEFYDEHPVGCVFYELTLTNFLDEVGAIADLLRDQARLRAQLVLGVLATYFELPALPADLRELTVPPAVGGGVSGPNGHAAPLNDDEVRAALARLPLWSGDRRGLVRSIELPPENLDRVLRRLERLKPENGRGPHIGQQNAHTAGLIVRTQSVDAVTALDVRLAHQVDAAIEQAGAGMST
jgi:pterin-4a-carbinolamine dehydratase